MAVTVVSSISRVQAPVRTLIGHEAYSSGFSHSATPNGFIASLAIFAGGLQVQIGVCSSFVFFVLSNVADSPEAEHDRVENSLVTETVRFTACLPADLDSCKACFPSSFIYA